MNEQEVQILETDIRISIKGQEKFDVNLQERNI